MTKQNNTTKYFLYARKSTEAEDRQVASIDDQIREMKKIASNRGLEIVKVFEESKSAKNLGRPVFSEMIEEIKKGKANGIICWKADRLARNMIDGGLLIDMLSKGQIDHICAYDAEYKSEDNVLFLAIAFGFSTQYSKDLAVNVKRGMKSRVERGWFSSKPPLGYTTLRENIKAESIVIKDDNFLLVKKLFKTVLNKKCSVPEICDLSFKLELRTRSNKKIGVSNMHHILSNPFYYGRFEYPKNSGDWYNGIHKPMITFSEHKKIKEIITRTAKPQYTKKAKYEFTYRGLFVCKNCKGAITATKVKKQQKNGNKHEYIYYHCRKIKDKNCNQKTFSIRDIELEKEVLKVIDKITITKTVYNVALAEMERDTKKDSQEKEQLLNQYQNSLKREQAKIENLIDMRAENEITKEQYANKKTKIEDNIIHYEDLINKLTNGDKEFKNNFIKAFEFATDLKEKFKNGDENKKKGIILNLDSNPSIYDRKPHFCLDLRLQPFEQYAKGAVEEIRHIQTSNIGEDYKKATPCEVANTKMWTM